VRSFTPFKPTAKPAAIQAAAQLFLYADIETIPTQDAALVAEIVDKHIVPDLDLAGITEAVNLTDPAKIKTDIEKRRAKAVAEHEAACEKAAQAMDAEYRKTALDATTGHIACISHALNDGTVTSHWNEALNRFATIQPDPDCVDVVPLADVLAGERKMLEGFFGELFKQIKQHCLTVAEVNWEAHEPLQFDDGLWKLSIPGTDGKYGSFVADREAWIIDHAAAAWRAPTIVAHFADFDVRYIWQRAIILGVTVPMWWPINAKPWDTDAIDDTMLVWAGAKGTIGLARLCRALGIPGKPDSIDGSRVWDAVREGRLSDVIDSCDGDVESLRAVHRRIRGIEAPRQQFVNTQIGQP
jgi:hypothetical protein